MHTHGKHMPDRIVLQEIQEEQTEQWKLAEKGGGRFPLVSLFPAKPLISSITSSSRFKRNLTPLEGKQSAKHHASHGHLHIAYHHSSYPHRSSFSNSASMPRSRPRRDPSSEAYDPQNLSFRGKISALIALGRIPLASEVPLWCLFGCLTSSQIFQGVNPRGEGPFRYWDWWATLQCMLIVWGTNISINYGKCDRTHPFHWSLLFFFFCRLIFLLDIHLKDGKG